MGKIEAVLFVETKQVSFGVLAKQIGVNTEEVAQAIESLVGLRNVAGSGIHVLVHDQQVSLVTNPAHAQLVQGILKEELSGELTRPQLETLTIIAYRGPLTRLEVEQIRGVNCQIILRNLQMRNLIEEVEGDLVATYRVTSEFLKTLGLTSISALPEYEAFRNDERISTLISGQNK